MHDLRQLSLAVSEIESLIPQGSAFILVDDGALPSDGFPDRRLFPFLGCGSAAGPVDDRTAVEELHRLRRLGARHIVITWTAFPLLERYAGFGSYLRSHFPCLFRDERILAFGLERYSKEALLHACAPRGSGELIGRLDGEPCASA